MPVAMERALERVADKRGLTGKDRDAFIYGTMRKTGWKPKQEVDKITKRETKLAALPTMKTRIDRLIQLNARTSNLMEFRRLPDGTEVDDEGHPIATATVGAAAGVGGVLGHQAIQRAGGYGEVGNRGLVRTATGVVAAQKSLDRAGVAGGVSALQKIGRALKSGAKAARYAMESKAEKLFELNAKIDGVIELGLLSNTGAGFMPKFRLTKQEFKDRFGMTPDELNRQTKTGPYEDPSRQNIRKQIAQGAGIASVAGAVGYAGYSAARSGHKAIKDAGGYGTVGKRMVSPITKRASAFKTAGNKAMSRANLIGVPLHWRDIGRYVKSGTKAARHI